MGLINRSSNLFNDLCLHGKFLDDIIPKKFTKIDKKSVHPPHSTSYFILRAITASPIIENIRFQNYDNFYDIGCGYGRVLLYMNNYFEKHQIHTNLIGVEFEKEIADRCKRNVLLKKGINILNDDALKIEYLDNSIFFLFNPLNEIDLKTFVDRVKLLSKFSIVFWGHNKFEIFEQFNPQIFDLDKEGKIKLSISLSK